jgi:hypothetical protein
MTGPDQSEEFAWNSAASMAQSSTSRLDHLVSESHVVIVPGMLPAIGGTVRGRGPSGLTSSVRARVSVVNPESDHVIQFSSKNSAGSISAAGETNQA